MVKTKWVFCSGERVREVLLGVISGLPITGTVAFYCWLSLIDKRGSGNAEK